MKFNLQYTDQKIHNSTGLNLIAKLLKAINADEIFKDYNLSKKSTFQLFSDKDILLSFIGLLATGNSRYEDVDFFKQDPIFNKALDLGSVPSKESIRQRLDEIASTNSDILGVLEKINFSLLKKYAEPCPIKNTDLVPVDFDVTVLDNTGSKKEGVEQSYRPKIKGYAPMMTNIGSQGYLLNHQFRKGSSHSNCSGTSEYITASMFYARSLCRRQKLLARFDSGNDSDINIFMLSQFSNAFFIMKKPLKGKNTKHTKYTLTQEVVENFDSKIKLDSNTVRYFSEKPAMAGVWDEKDELQKVDCRLILSVVEIHNDLNTGQPLLIPYRSLHLWRTNLPKSKYSAQDIVALYKDHGTSEQFHSEFKSDLDIERLPSSKYKTNEVIVALSQLVFNLLRIIGQKALCYKLFNPKNKYSRIRIRTVILKIMNLPSLVFRKHKRWTIALPRSNPVSKIFYFIHYMF